LKTWRIGWDKSKCTQPSTYPATASILSLKRREEKIGLSTSSRSRTPPLSSVSVLHRNVNKIIIGNKCDVSPENREVSREEGEALAAQYGVQFFETSAKANIGVTEAFTSITNDVVERLGNEEVGRSQDSRVKVDGQNQGGAKKRACCGWVCSETAQ
jgi:hypothetical protein